MKNKGRVLWTTLTSLFTLLTIGSFVGGSLANNFKKTINDYFNLPNFTTLEKEANEDEDLEYFKSKYTSKDGSFDDISLNKKNVLIADQVQREGTTILWNNGGLPLNQGNKVSLFSKSSTDFILAGFGSGKSNSTNANLKTAMTNAKLEVNDTLWNFYSSGAGKSYTRSRDKVNEVPWNLVNDNCANSFSNYGDAAIIVLGRQTGEYDDWGDAEQVKADTITGDFYDLHQNEKDALENIIKLKNNGTFKKIIVLLNCATGMNFKMLDQYRDDIDSCLWVGMPGKEGTIEIARILAGTSIPSGHLADTFLYDNQSAPANVNSDFNPGQEEYYMYTNFNSMQGTRNKRYQAYYAVYAEGIYVGYKYFETRYEDSILNQGNASSKKGAVHSETNWKYNEEVAFPFGYGSSFTEFEYSNYKVSKKSNGDYTVSLDVKNVGQSNGADAVQIYVQKPYTDHDIQYGLEQSSVNLAGYAKTKELIPNESVTVNINVRADAFKTYDHVYHKTYIYEPGEYYIAAGQDSHDAINNILAAKGKTMQDGMDAKGDSNLVYKFENKKLDTETFSISSTGAKITNQLSDGDWNLYQNKTEAEITYLSRSDWDKTYPEHVKLSLNDKMVYDLSWDKPVKENPNDKMPLYGQDKQFNLIDLRGKEYNHPSWDNLLNQMTLQEQSELMASAYHGTKSVNSINKPADVVNDGPLGIRMNYKTNSNRQTMNFPIIPLLAATFNDYLAYQVGQCQGEDCLHAGCNGMYSPGANMHRSIYNGRTYEYYSEDPFISGMMCMQQTKGIQESGTYVTLKHFALNEAEDKRFGIGTWADEQTIRETYLPAFQYAVEEAGAKSVMSAYNRIGVLWSGAHKGLQTEILRNEWGFDGFVISDCAWRDFMGVVDGLMAGNDCILYEMLDKQCYAKQASGNATICLAMREAVHRILYVTVNSSTMNGISSNTEIIDVTNWWQYAIVGLEITMAICLAGSIIMLIFTFIPKRDTKERKIKVLTEEEKMIRDRRKKKTIIITSSIAGVILVSQAIMIPILINMNKHICDEPCPVCGLCTDMSCDDSACAEKCSGHNPSDYIGEGAQTYRFEAEGCIFETTSADAAIGCEENANNPSGGNYVMKLDYEGESTLTYNIVSDKDAYAVMSCRFGRRQKAYYFNDMFTIYLNDEVVEIDGGVTIDKMADDGVKYFDWTDTEICLLKLKKGNNELVFYNNTRECLNFDSFDLYTTASVGWKTELDGTHLNGKWELDVKPSFTMKGSLKAHCHQCSQTYYHTLPEVSTENGYKRIDDIHYSYEHEGQEFIIEMLEYKFNDMELEVIGDKVYFKVEGAGYGYDKDKIIVTNVNKVPLGISQTVSYEDGVYAVYIDVTDHEILEDPYIFIDNEPFNGSDGKISLGRSDKTKRPIDALYFNEKKYTIQMQYNTPKIIIESVSSTTSFISTDTARFEIKDNKLYYVASGTAYNVPLDDFGFDFIPTGSSSSVLEDQMISAKVIKNNGYNFNFEVWSDISNIEAAEGYFYPHIFNNGVSQDMIDYFFASNGKTIEFNNKIYTIVAQATTYNMPVLTIVNK